MITRLKTSGFKKLSDHEFHFREGLNLVVGPNWGGKSTLVQAILYAIGGPTLTGSTLSRLITRGQERMEVELDFDGCRIVRGPNRGLLIDMATGATLASGQGPLTAALSERFNLPVKHWGMFCVTRQGEAGRLLEAGSSQLSKLINEVSGIDTVDAVLSKLGERQTALAEQGRDLSRHLEHLDHARAELEAERHMKIERQALQADKLAEREQLAESVAHYRAELMDLENRQAQFETASHAHSQLVSRISYLEESITQALRSRPAEVDALTLTAAQERLNVLNAQYADWVSWSGQLDRTQKLLDSALPQEEAARRVLEALEAPDPMALAEARGRLEEARMTAQALRLAVDALDQTLSGAVCQTCQRPFDAAFDRSDVEARRYQAHERWKLQEHTACELSTTVEQLARASQEYHEAQTASQQWGRYSQELRERLADLQTHTAGYDAQARLEAQQRVETLKVDQALWRSHETALFKLREELVERQRALQACQIPEPVDTSRLEACQSALEPLIARLTALELELAGLDSELAERVRHEGMLARHLELAEQRAESAKKAAAELGLVQALAKFLRKNRDRYQAAIWEQLLSYANAFIAEATSGTISRLSRSDDGTFIYHEDGFEMGVADASGMQEAILGTALKLSLGAALGVPAGVMIFDEVTAAGEESVALAVTGLLARQSSQVILISHREADSAVADHVIRL